MYLEHFGLTEHPFRITPHTEFFFSGANRGATLDALMYAITHDEGIVKVTGEVGSGKTMLCRVLLERLPSDVVSLYLATPSLTREDILYTLAAELGLAVPDQARAAQLLRLLQDQLIKLYGEGKHVVVLIDEAHVMPAETLEEIRLLSNLESNRHKLLKLVLFGQPELNDILAQSHMRQLKERITHNFSLEPLISRDITEYINFRLRAAGYHGPSLFPPSAIKLISEASHGLTRRINILADKSLLAAFSRGSHDIDPATIRSAIQDCDFSTHINVATNTQQRKLIPALMATLALGAGLATYLYKNQTPVATPQAPPPLAEITLVATPVADEPNTALSHPLQTEVTELPIKPAIPLGPLTVERLKSSQQWLAQTPEDRWFIQMTATDIQSAGNIDQYLQRLDQKLPAADTHIYLVQKGKSQKLGVIHGNFASQRAAQDFIAALPKDLRNSNPYPRPVRHLH